MILVGINKTRECQKVLTFYFEILYTITIVEGFKMIVLEKVRKVYKAKKTASTVALDNVSFKIPSKGLYFITGESGSGKSTLLNIIGGLDKIDTGSIKVGNLALETLSKKDLVKYRNTCVGFIFQDYNLFLEYNVYDNVKLALELSNQESKTDIEEILKRVGLYDLRLRNINELSGGQRQRVAIARALVKNPQVILADEPTGNLDSDTSRQIMELLKEISKDKCVIVVTHDKTLVNEFASGFIIMQDGKVVDDNIVALKDDESVINLRKSNFKSKYALKFTLHNIKMKPVKFIMTLILTAFALSWVCIMFSFILFDKNKYTARVLREHNVYKVGIQATKCTKGYDYVDCNPKSLEATDTIVKEGSPVYDIRDLKLKYGPVEDNNKVIASNDIVEIKNDNILKLLNGRLPQNDNEIVIDKNIAYDILKYGIYDKENVLTKPDDMNSILGLETYLGKYLVTIVGINEFQSDQDFLELRQNLPVSPKVEMNFNQYTEDNNIYVKGLVDNQEMIYTSEEMLNNYQLPIRDSKLESSNIIGVLTNVNYYNENIKYYDLNFNLVNKKLASDEVVISANDILNAHSYKIGDFNKLFNDYQKNNKDVGYDEAFFNFIKEVFTKYKDVFNVELYNFINSLKRDNNTTKLKVVGISFDDNSYISEELYNIIDHDKKIITKVYIGFDTKEELDLLVKKYSYQSNIFEEGEMLSLVSDLGGYIAGINIFYHYVRPYLNIITLVIGFFAILLIFNFINVTVSYAKKNIGILKSLGAKNKDIYKIFSYESLIIAVLAFLLGIPMWNGACKMANMLFFNDEIYIGGMEINALAPLITLVLSLVLSWLVSMLSCNKISKMQPVDAILNK